MLASRSLDQSFESSQEGGRGALLLMVKIGSFCYIKVSLLIALNFIYQVANKRRTPLDPQKENQREMPSLLQRLQKFRWLFSFLASWIFKSINAATVFAEAAASADATAVATDTAVADTAATVCSADTKDFCGHAWWRSNGFRFILILAPLGSFIPVGP